jgi:hypothetical protein
VKGTLSPAFAAAFDGFSATTSQHCIRLVGWLPDQERLHGALGPLGALSVELISVAPPTESECMPPGEDAATRLPAPGDASGLDHG